MKIRTILALAALAAPAAAAAGMTAGGVTYIPAPDVSAAFAKGAPLVETGRYKIHASRREAPGQAEVHQRDTDIIYVLEGTATIVTGGEVLEGRTTAPEEIRGSGIRGGETRALVKGDVMVVPGGTPHWFKGVDGVFVYYVVKVPS
jgi:glc operon protein GlcG